MYRGGGPGTAWSGKVPGSIPGTGRFQTEIVQKPIEFASSPWPGLTQRGAADPLKSNIFAPGPSEDFKSFDKFSFLSRIGLPTL